MVWRAFVEKRPWDGWQYLRIMREEHDGRFSLVQPLVFKTYERGMGFPVGEFTLGGNSFTDNDVKEFLQAMADLAWDERIRPVAMQDHTNELNAVRDHLNDMRSLVLTKKGTTRAN